MDRLRIEEAMGFGMERSGSLKFIEGCNQLVGLGFTLFDRAPEPVAIGAGLKDVCPVRDAIESSLADER